MIVLLFYIIEHNGKIRQCLIVLSYFIIFRSQTPWFELPVIDEPSRRTRDFISGFDVCLSKVAIFLPCRFFNGGLGD